MNTQPTNDDDGQTWHFPGDLAALVSLPFITLAFSFLFTWLTSPAAIIWVAALPGFVGLVMLIRARLPLYRQHQFLSFVSARARCGSPTALLEGLRFHRSVSRGAYAVHRRSLMPPWPSNQAMQLTASKPAVYARSVCRLERILRSMHPGLAAADLVSR